MTVLTDGTDAVFMFLLIFTVVDVSFHPWTEKTRSWYETGRPFVKLSPPRWVFALLLIVVYVIFIAAMFVYVHDKQFSPGFYFDSVVILSAIVALMHKAWLYVFFKLKRMMWALVISVVIVLALLVCLVLTGLDAEWTTFGLLLFYGLWCLYLVAFSAYWYWYQKECDGIFPMELDVQVEVETPLVNVCQNYAQGSDGNNNNNNNSGFNANTRARGGRNNGGKKGSIV